MKKTTYKKKKKKEIDENTIQRDENGRKLRDYLCKHWQIIREPIDFDTVDYMNTL